RRLLARPTRWRFAARSALLPGRRYRSGAMKVHERCLRASTIPWCDERLKQDGALLLDSSTCLFRAVATGKVQPSSRVALCRRSGMSQAKTYTGGPVIAMSRFSMTDTLSPLLLYRQAIERYGFHSDPAQWQAAQSLDDCHRALHDPQSGPQPSAGVYLWGPVGRGKTWLMDSFYRSLR